VHGPEAATTRTSYQVAGCAGSSGVSAGGGTSTTSRLASATGSGVVTMGSVARSSGCTTEMSHPTGRATANSSSQMSSRFHSNPATSWATPPTPCRKLGTR
jgi:hypothetical protein